MFTIIENMPATQLSMCVRVALKLNYHMTLYTLDDIHQNHAYTLNAW